MTEQTKLAARLGTVLRAMRKTARLDTFDVKNLTDIPVRDLVDYERGKKVPTDETIAVLTYTYKTLIDKMVRNNEKN